MKTISAIYQRVRHHLHDDWAYGNDLDAKPWDFQQQEFVLKASIEHFNSTYYQEGGEVSGLAVASFPCCLLLVFVFFILSTYMTFELCEVKSLSEW